MIFLLAGAGVLVLLLVSLNAFARAPTGTVRHLGAWVIGIGAILVTGLLFLAGLGPRILMALALFGPTLWRQWQRHGAGYRSASDGGSAGGTASGGAQTQARQSSAMTREEAYQVLGLKPGATEAEVIAAHRRLMRMAHPDTGGSDWLASRINQARDLLLG